MKLSAWPNRQAAAKNRKRAKPIDRAAIDAQAVEHLVASRGMTLAEARAHVAEVARRSRK